MFDKFCTFLYYLLLFLSANDLIGKDARPEKGWRLCLSRNDLTVFETSMSGVIFAKSIESYLVQNLFAS